MGLSIPGGVLSGGWIPYRGPRCYRGLSEGVSRGVSCSDMGVCKEIPVIDLFAGPGGLGEGFSALRGPGGDHAFRVRLSIEMDEHSHQTLMLRSFFRQFDDGEVPSAYYEYLRGEERWLGAGVEDLLDDSPDEGQRAREEAWCEELRPDIADLVNVCIYAPVAVADWTLDR
jgi:hypothetical protein